MDDDQRHGHDGVVEQFLFPQPVIPQVVAVVTAEDYEGAGPQPSGGEVLEENSKLIVELLNQAHIGRNDMSPF